MVLCRGQGAAFIGRGELGAQDGTGVARACRGRHGDVRERRLAGQGRNGRGARGSREVWACRCRSGASREGVCRPGWSLCAHARKLFDSRAHDMFPKNAARGGGSWCEGASWGASREQGQAPGRAGSGFWCRFGTSEHGGGHLHAIGVLGLGLGHGDAWACPERGGVEG